jgi:hypothetical protein
MSWRSQHILLKFKALFPDVVPSEVALKTLSLTQANQDIMAMIAGFHKDNTTEWWFVFEDDIGLAVAGEKARSAIDSVLELAHADGIASLGMCGVSSGQFNVTINGIEFSKNKGCCMQAMAYTTSKAALWLNAFRSLHPKTSLRPDIRYAVDIILIPAVPGGRIWLAGSNLPSPDYTTDKIVGIMYQNRSFMKSARTTHDVSKKSPSLALITSI